MMDEQRVLPGRNGDVHMVSFKELFVQSMEKSTTTAETMQRVQMTTKYNARRD